MPAAKHLPLVTKNLNYKSGQTCLINDINLELGNKDITVILGHNGAGKSLLLKLLHGVLKPTSGTIHWNRTTPAINQYWRAMVLQKPTFFKRSVRYNIEFALKVANLSPKSSTERCTKALEVCGLNEISDRPASVLSGGQKQRLSLARAWALQPSVLLLDEPTVALDPPAVKKIERLITQFEELRTKIIMTTHDLAQAKRLAKDILFMDKGVILEQRSAEDFFQSPYSKTAQDFLAGKL